MDMLQPSEEMVLIDPRYNWELPLRKVGTESRKLRSVWYIGLPLTSAHRGSHSGGGALIEGVGGQERYLNEGTVYPHSSLMEIITYHQICFPAISWKYLDMSHHKWHEIRELIQQNPPDVAAFSTYTATYLWALIVAAEIKRVNPSAIIIFGNDHASLLYKEVLLGAYGRQIVDFVGTGNNGPFTTMGLLYMLQGQLEITRVPSLAYRSNDSIIHQYAPTYPINKKILPDYRLIKDELEQHYDKAFNLWYAQHYELKRMVTIAIDGGCNWGRNPKRRCKHCSIQGLTPKSTNIETAIPVLETLVGELHSNVYAAGDSTFGFSQNQWGGEISFLDQLAEACERSPVLRPHRFMLAYGLIAEFLKSAELCKGFIRTWNVGIEAFDPQLLKKDSKGINKGTEQVYEAFELAKRLDYKLYVSGILGLPGTTLKSLKNEVDAWLSLTETYQELITTVSVSLPAVIPGSRMYWEAFTEDPAVKAMHGEIIASRKLSEMFIKRHTSVEIADVEAAITDLARGVISIAQRGGNPVKFGGYMFGGTDEEEKAEKQLLDSLCAQLKE
jgi:radical SAM superfamily enzyme YgiQ (UPF0313 family)